MWQKFMDDWFTAIAFAVLVVIALVIATWLTACTPQPGPELVTHGPVMAAQAAEFDPAPPAAARYKATLIREARLSWGPVDVAAVLGAQIQQESGWNPAARSPAGAGGLAQFVPSTAADFGLAPQDVYNPDLALRAQAQYMAAIYQRMTPRFTDACQRMGASLGGYNGGEGHVRDRQALASAPQDYFGSVRLVQPPRVSAASQTENERYAPHIIKLQISYIAWGNPWCEGVV